MKKLRTCELWFSKNENAATFFPNDLENCYDNLEKDAKLLYSIEAYSWREANEKLHELSEGSF
jgi:hypothetical protein